MRRVWLIVMMDLYIINNIHSPTTSISATTSNIDNNNGSAIVTSIFKISTLIRLLSGE
ncbi:MAG: hypothetical protein H7296_06345 [Bacteroidia bacterium]|nr:hypothetical protein [Bacteroidia bacterium]